MSSELNESDDSQYKKILDNTFYQIDSIIDALPQENNGFLDYYFSGSICSHLLQEAESYRLVKIDKNKIIDYSSETTFGDLDKLFFYTGFKPKAEAKIIDFGYYENLEERVLSLVNGNLKLKFLKNDDLALNNIIKVSSRGRDYFMSHPVENFSLTFLDILENYKEKPKELEDELVFWYECKSLNFFKDKTSEGNIIETLFDYVYHSYEKNPFDETKVNSFFTFVEKNRFLFFPFKMIIIKILDYDKKHKRIFPDVKI